MVTDLLADLVDRGLSTERAVLFVIDGAKALRKAIRDVFGDDHGVVQRCQRILHNASYVVSRTHWIASIRVRRHPFVPTHYLLLYIQTPLYGCTEASQEGVKTVYSLSGDKGNRSMKRVWLLTAVATVLAATAGSEIHRWIDKDGNVHYSDSPPSGVATELIKPPSTPSKGDILRTQVRTDLLIEQQKASRVQRAQERKEREEKRIQRAIAAQQVIGRREACIRAQQSLYALLMRRPVFSIGARGERVFVDDEFRQSEIEKMRRVIAANCEVME